MSIRVLLAVSGCAAGTAAAQRAPEATLPAEQVPPPLEVEVDGRWSLDLSLRYASDAFSRGIVQRSDAFNLQPSVEIGYKLFAAEAWSLNVFGGLWGHFTDDTVPGEDGGFDERLNEVDAYLGFTAEFAERWTATAVYTWYASPASNFEAVEDLTLSVALDDAGLWGGDDRFALRPYALLAIETGSDGADGGDENGVYFEVGLAPSLNVYEGGAGGVTLALPIAAGFSLRDFYELDGEDETFGFATVGVQASYALPEGRLGQWTFTAGVDYLLLGDHAEAYNGGDDDEWIVYAEVGWSF